MYAELLVLRTTVKFVRKEGIARRFTAHQKRGRQCVLTSQEVPRPMPIESPASDELPQLSAESLFVAAQREQARPTRSRLEPCAQVIFILRRKRWSFAAITAWLAQNGVRVAESTVQRFYQTRCRNDPARGDTASDSTHPPESFFDQAHENSQARPGRSSAQPGRKPKFNTDF